jgi:hypothetical protein
MRSCIICAAVKFYITIIPIGCISLKDVTLKEKNTKMAIFKLIPALKDFVYEI